MSALSGHVDEYLRARRALGVKLQRHGRLLPQLVAYLEAAGASTVNSDLAISWAGSRGHCSPRLPQIPLCEIAHNGIYVPRAIMLRARLARCVLPAERDLRW